MTFGLSGVFLALSQKGGPVPLLLLAEWLSSCTMLVDFEWHQQVQAEFLKLAVSQTQAGFQTVSC